jgi:hypothetical protein
MEWKEFTIYYFIHPIPSCSLKAEAKGSSETLVIISLTVRGNIPCASNFRWQRLTNLKCYSLYPNCNQNMSYIH